MTTNLLPNSTDAAITHTLRWLALSLTPGIGAGRGRKLLEQFGGVDRIFGASLTELESSGLPAASAQSIALGKSLDLAADELDRVKALGGLMNIDLPSLELSIRRPTGWEWPSAFRATLPHVASSS